MKTEFTASPFHVSTNCDFSWYRTEMTPTTPVEFVLLCASSWCNYFTATELYGHKSQIRHWTKSINSIDKGSNGISSKICTNFGTKRDYLHTEGCTKRKKIKGEHATLLQSYFSCTTYYPQSCCSAPSYKIVFLLHTLKDQTNVCYPRPFTHPFTEGLEILPPLWSKLSWAKRLSWELYIQSRVFYAPSLPLLLLSTFKCGLVSPVKCDWPIPSSVSKAQE